MQKSIMVAVERWITVPKYKFRMKRHSKIMAHDENNDCHIGDLVRIQMSRCAARLSCSSALRACCSWHTLPYTQQRQVQAPPDRLLRACTGR